MLNAIKPATDLHSASDVRVALLAAAYEIQLRVKRQGPYTPEGVRAEIVQLATAYANTSIQAAVNLCAVLPEIHSADTRTSLARIEQLGQQLDAGTADESDVRDVAIATFAVLLVAVVRTLGIEVR